MKEALEKDVDLVEYGQKIESDLMAAAKGSVADYIAESTHLATLHKLSLSIPFIEGASICVMICSHRYRTFFTCTRRISPEWQTKSALSR